MLSEFFSERKIEYYAVLDYADCPVIREGIMDRESFTPRSVIIYLLPYYTGESRNISKYAQSLDYHILLEKINCELANSLFEEYPGAMMKGYGDHSPLAEVYTAAIAGLGVIGENKLLLNEKYGSYVFIGEMITDIPAELIGGKKPSVAGKCIGCGKCVENCPTGALTSGAADCLSAITQKKGELTDTEIQLMKRVGTVWGCDECQSVCPYNVSPIPTPIPFFYEERMPELTTELVDSLSKDEFRARAFSWRGASVIRRNLAALAREDGSETKS